MPPSSLPLATLRAVLGRLIPGDDFPGALDAEVENYFARQLAGDCAHEAAATTAGLLQLDREAAARHAGQSFAALSAAQQDALLSEIESGRIVTAWPAGLLPAAFFARLIELAHEGFYADPANGGNREAASWRMIGYDPHFPADPPLRPASP